MGTLESASDFPSEARALQCRWEICHDEDAYEVLEGATSGITHLHALDARRRLANFAVLNHTIDARFVALNATAPPPKLKVCMYMLSSSSSLEPVGYGSAALPLLPGSHTISLHCWRPTGTLMESLTAKFLGRYPALADTSILVKDGGTRFGLPAESTGLVYLTINCLTVPQQ